MTSRAIATLTLCVLLALVGGCRLWDGGEPLGEPFGQVGSFSVQDTTGETWTPEKLKGKVWVASFLFTRCLGGCPQVTASMEEIQKRTKDRKDLLLVSFTVDPARDNPNELKQFADKFHADPARWKFLLGQEDSIHKMIREQFKLGIQRNNPGEGREVKPGFEIDHPLKLVLVDKNGAIRGYFPGLPHEAEGPEGEKEQAKAMQKLRAQIDMLLREKKGTEWLVPSAEANAFLNGLAGIFLVGGLALIFTGHRKAHTAAMLCAVLCSAVFLGYYLTYHLVIKSGLSTSFTDRAPLAPDWVRYSYLAILLTHTVLAIIITPLALRLVWLGFKEDFTKHKRLARWVYPYWLYVAITGVVVYWMLYRLPGAAEWN